MSATWGGITNHVQLTVVRNVVLSPSRTLLYNKEGNNVTIQCSHGKPNSRTFKFHPSEIVGARVKVSRDPEGEWVAVHPVDGEGGSLK